jgi:hypothetical protein
MRYANLMAIMLLGLASACFAGDPPTTTPTKSPTSRPTGPVSLFNGKDLTGWVWYTDAADSKVEDVWSVVDGSLHCKGVPSGYLRTEQEFESFVLKMQVRHITEGNGGVLLRVIGPDRVWPQSIEAQGQRGSMGDIYNIGFQMQTDPERTEGRRTERLHPNVPERPLGQWNEYEIQLDGEKLVVILNGVVQNIATECKVVPGKIALQSEGGEYEFRNIKLTPIVRAK